MDSRIKLKDNFFYCEDNDQKLYEVGFVTGEKVYNISKDWESFKKIGFKYYTTFYHDKYNVIIVEGWVKMLDKNDKNELEMPMSYFREYMTELNQANSIMTPGYDDGKTYFRACCMDLTIKEEEKGCTN